MNAKTPHPAFAVHKICTVDSIAQGQANGISQKTDFKVQLL